MTEEQLASRKQYFVHVGPGVKERSIGAGKKRFQTVDEAARALRWARGNYWRIAKVTVEEIPGTDSQTLHEAAMALCATQGHEPAEQDGVSDRWFCPRCTTSLDGEPLIKEGKQ